MSQRSEYWSRVHRRAFKETAELFGLDSKRQIVTRVTGALIVMLVLAFWGSEGAAQDEMLIRFAIIAVIILIFPIPYLWKLASVPPAMHREVVIENDSLLEKLRATVTPRLRLNLSSEPFRRLNFGGTSESPFAGHRQTQIFASETILRIECQNISGFRIAGCKANLVDAKTVGEDGAEIDIGFREYVPLSWSRNLEKEEFQTDIEAGLTKLIYVFACRPAGMILYRDLRRDLPLEYHQIFSKPRPHRLWIQVSGASDAAARICVDVRKNSDADTWTVTERS